jgi:hypothetical protein
VGCGRVLCGAIDGQGVEVVAQGLGAEVLLSCEPGDAGQMLQGQSVLDALEGFLDAPAGVVQIAKVGGRIVDGVEQRGHPVWMIEISISEGISQMVLKLILNYY